MTPYDTREFDHDGRRFRMSVYPDNDMGAPWDEHYGHGPVRYVPRARFEKPRKAPGEWLMFNRSHDAYAYDAAAAQVIALRDGWGITGGILPGESKRAYAARAVRADFERMRDYVHEQWSWVGVAVQLLDSDGHAVTEQYEHALWGIESDAGDYLQEVARELADQCLHERGETSEQLAAARAAAAAEAQEHAYWESRDVVTV